MAVGLLNYTVADLCVGKPPLRRLSASSSTVGDALAALKSSTSGDPFVSVWACNCLDIDNLKNQEPIHHKSCCPRQLVCVGRVCMVDIISYLCKKVGADSSLRPSAALKAPLAVLLSEESKNLVRHVEPSSSLVQAMDLILQGAQHLVVPIENPRKKHLMEYCWLGQEDLIRFFLNSIGQFLPAPTLSIESLNLIAGDFPVLPFDSPAISAIEEISRHPSTAAHQCSIAVVEENNVLVGEISPLMLSYCDESLVAAVMTLSGGELMGYVENCVVGPPPEELVRAVEEGLREKKLSGVLEEFLLWCSDEVDSCQSSSDEESASPPSEGRHGRVVRRADPIVCRRWSSLVAVMVQATAHDVSYVWVVDGDGTAAGIVGFEGILGILREYLEDMV